MCCSLLGPIVGASEGDQFEDTWIDGQVKHIVAFAYTLEFHRKTGEVLTIPWKNTAKRDAWAHRRALAQQDNNNREVQS
ncbi:MAG: hypothetical protein VB025_04680 [Sphaerochaeta sp.]|nr:hypothetical protein [Sphaerochaeta sp.]